MTGRGDADTVQLPEDLALLVLKPDAVVQGLTGRIVSWVEERGFRPMHYRELWLTPERRAALYGRAPRRGVLDWDLLGLLYTLGPVRALLLAGPPTGGSPAELLASMKGGAFPHLAATGTMRGDLGALNPFCNLVHTADDQVDARRGAALLFGDCRPGTSLPDLDRARGELPVPTPLWTTVRDAAERLVARCGGPRMKSDWPADADGPCPAAFAGFARIWDDTAERMRTHNLDAAVWMAGLRAGHVPYAGWHNLTGPASSAADWGNYLAYTTVRSVDLCLATTDPVR